MEEITVGKSCHRVPASNIECLKTDCTMWDAKIGCLEVAAQRAIIAMVDKDVFRALIKLGDWCDNNFTISRKS
ncbi:MAG: hypothetical protein HPY53_01655 [Brevinematales bacterium]|nr:hypothetical protein [Brevinematales bacterium]